MKAIAKDDSGTVHFGQSALELIRKNPDLYRQLASRYILIGHSMGGVVSREYVQGNFYNGDVDKIITLDSPHEGTGTMNMIAKMNAIDDFWGHLGKNLESSALSVVPQMLLLGNVGDVGFSITTISSNLLRKELGNLVATALSPEYYVERDPLLHYVDPKQTGFGTIDSLNGLSYEPDSMPMIRILSGRHGMTMSDPGDLDDGLAGGIRTFIPDYAAMPYLNYNAQLEGSGDMSARYVNALTSFMMGYAGIPVQQTGSSIVPDFSSNGSGVDVLNDPMIDVERAYFNAAPSASGTLGDVALIIESVTNQIRDLDLTLGYICSPCANAAKIALGFAGAEQAAPSIIPAAIAGKSDMEESHQISLYWDYLDTMKASFNTYSLQNGSFSYTPYLMEDFLYERPFVNLALNDTATLNQLQGMSDSARDVSTLNRNCYYVGSRDAANCAVGLFKSSTDLNSYQKAQAVSSLSPLRFKSESDWSKMGVKVDRWERVPGLRPDGTPDDTIVPIRHVERYEVPAITADDRIEKYSFVVDDLMPHRLRQIRMNFNYQEEIAWECDVSKDYDTNDNCTVYKRTSGSEWTELRKEKHPVKKNGQFDFEPRKYGYDNLLAIQKDNQNTVTISTVNKIGLSNTQRFYYLFKATDDLLVPMWPKRDVAVNSISGFEAYASVLDYQGFSVVGMRDSVWYTADGVRKTFGNLQDMDFLRSEGSGNVYRSRISESNLTEGEHHWVFNAITHNSAGESNDSNDVYDVPFNVDVTPPNFELSVDKPCMNPDSSVFIARFAWGDSTIPDIRAMRWQLEKSNGNGFSLITSMPSLYDVTSKDFAVAWDKVPNRENLQDGLYRVKALAIDYAAPNLEAYDFATGLVTKIAGGNDRDSDWSTLGDYSFNRTEKTIEFRIDRTAPELNFEKVGGSPVDSFGVEKYAGFSRPSRNQDLEYVSEDSLLQVEYLVKEPLGGRDSTAVTIGWDFAHVDDVSKVDRAGDSVWVRDASNVGYGTWTEMSGMRLQDGDYILRASVRDEAKNTKAYDYTKKIRIDRTAPKIVSLVSSRLVYPDSVKDFAATLNVSESDDIATNRTGMRCHYHVLGGDADGLWRNVSEGILKTDTVRFDIPAVAVGERNGKRYLEAVCLDAAGNSSVRTDLFHVGNRYPEIVSPAEDREFLTAEYIPIVGIAPPASASAENTTVYRLRYRYENSDEWLTDNIAVVASNRSEDSSYISKTAQSTEGVLGYLHNVGFSESKVYIELSTRSCETCEWQSDSTLVTVDEVSVNEESPKVVFDISSAVMEVGKDSLSMSLRLEGNFNHNYLLHLYAEDSKGVGLFDKSMERVFANPFYGEPADTALSRGVWFYEKEGAYHLKWKGLESSDSIKVSFDSNTFGETCLSSDGLGNMDLGCSVSDEIADYSYVQSAAGSYLSSYPIWQFPAYTDKLMTLFGASGHLTMQSSGAFRIAGNGSISDANIPVYFGSHKESGFAFMDLEQSSSVNPWNTGWSVNPKSYGLNYVWNGISSTNTYPPSGSVTLHAEVVENSLDNPFATLIDTVVTLVLPEMEISLPELSEFYLIDNSADSLNSDTVDEDTTTDTEEVKLYDLGSLNIPYGILYRDAYVSIKITDSEGNVVRTLQDSVFTRANAKRTAYSVLWDAKDAEGFAVEPGKYRVVIDAYEVEGSHKKTASTELKISLKKMVPAFEDGTNLVVSEAFDDNGKNRYVPVPDYLVRTDIAAKYLPTDLRNGVTLNADVLGTQRIYGYAPKRFSLAIKRHRKQLDLVYVEHFHAEVEQINGNYNWTCEEGTLNKQDFVTAGVLDFSSTQREHVLPFIWSKKSHGFDGKDYPANNYIDIVVFTLKGFQDFLEEEQLDSISTLDDFNKAKRSNYVVWKLDDYSEKEGFYLPGTDKVDSVQFGYQNNGLGCKADEGKDALENTCDYGADIVTTNYNPNKNLLDLVFYPGENEIFFDEFGTPNTHCSREGFHRYQRANFSIKFKIPDSYWDAPFGMDNLVNRTVRFDHTNKTIYAESASGTDGYMAALQKDLKNKSVIDEGNYFDGTSWKFDRTYGLLTPYEMQALPFLPASELQGGKNTFLFADEDSTHQQPSYFDLKFYGPRSDKDYFKAIVLGNPLESTTGCDYGNATNYDAAYQLAIDGYVHNPRCQVSVTSKNGEPDSIRTPLYNAGYVYFYVGRNMMWSQGYEKIVDFPAPTNVLDTISGKCADNEEWSEVKETAGCKKFYKGGSKIHYYLDDFDNAFWETTYTSDGIIKNPVNSPAHYHAPNDIGYLDESKIGNTTAVSNLLVKPNSSNYKDASFYVSLDTLAKLKGEKNGYSVESIDARLSASDAKKARFSTAFDTLYFDTKDTVIKNRYYRESQDSVSRIPTQMKPANLPLKYFYRGFHSWIKEPKVDSIDILHLDSTEHSHFAISSEKTLDDRVISFKDAKDIDVARPKELVELKAYLTSGQKYQLSYLKGGTYYVIKDTIASVSGSHRLAWFDVNRLQGNTQFLLTWGGKVDELYYNTYNLYVGSDVNPDNESTVHSLFGELSVTFPTNSLQENKDVTVRTAEVDDYPFEEFNNMPLTGPVMEVLPSMEFNDTTKLPRIQMRISKAEMDSKGVTPQTLTLYKIDFDNKKFVPLTNALYGYLNADGRAAVSTGSSEKATCSTWNSEECYPGENNWEYILISAETKTFSVFAAISSVLAETPDFDLEILPEVAASAERIVKVKGIGNYALYVDDDPLWNGKGDMTPAVPLTFTVDLNGYAHVSLPTRNGVIDTNYIFVVAKSEPDSLGNSVELPSAPAVARALTVPSEYACSVPSDSLWLGLDNGYMAYGAECNQPGVGTVSLYRDGKLVTEIHGDNPDTIFYDGSRILGTSVVGKIADGIYESRYLGVSTLGMEQQVAGPSVYTDSMRPSVEGFDVQESSEILDRVFTVTAKVSDLESGIAAVTVSPEFGGVALDKMSLIPDSAGTVSAALRLTRRQMTECLGCRLRLTFRAEDYGHNHADTTFATDNIYPYPSELALWYPAREGSGQTAYEFLGTGHDLNLASVSSPWQSDVGIYFGHVADFASGKGRVDLGTADSYTLEARIKRGYSSDSWNEILSFKGSGGLSIRLLQKGRSLKLSEGGREWFSGEVLSASTKTWEHVAVVSDSSGVRFYVDGERAKSVPDGIDAERELYGTLTLGGSSNNSYIGNIADIRLYSGALSDEEIFALSVPVADDGDLSDVIVVAVKDMEMLEGFSGQFSCAVAGNRYLLASSAHSKLRMTLNVETSGNYSVVAYARSANLTGANISVGEGALLSGQIGLSGAWRATEISGVTLSLSSGVHTISLDVPEGVQIGGIALAEKAVSPSMIAWGRSSFDESLADAVSPKIQTFLKYEGFDDRSMLRPRIRLKNVSDETIKGYSVRYYFRGEDPSQVQTSAFYPQDSTLLAVHSESPRTGYAEWKFTDSALAPQDSAFYGDGPHFGLYNFDWSPWNAEDDPSYVAAAEYGFVQDEGIVVLDSNNNLIGGSCAEMEDETSIMAKARVLAFDMRSDNQASEIHFKVENLGSVVLRNFDVRYYFYVEEGLAPILDINHLASCSTADMESLGSGRWQVSVHCEGSIGAGNVMGDPVNFSLHLSEWANVWNASDDPSHAGLSGAMAEARGICVFDSLGNRVYGDSPDWPESSVIASEQSGENSVTTPDNGYHGDGSIPVVRTDEGLVLTLENWTTLSLDLVNAVGIPVKSIFAGTLAPGEQFVQVNWSGINMKTTYLVLKVNGTIQSTKLLSLM
ncbi:LamG-like jellyroll fold domain-containing protein [Hallerella succinigenes]|nr:LamG-like jellyroll fold domain-containing protein [Hallerella succinigenes]